MLDVRLAQAKPKVESEPIFVALRSLPQGAAVTVWDVALRDWPGWQPQDEATLAQEVRRAAYEVIKRKGATNHAIGLVTAELIGCLSNLTQIGKRHLTATRGGAEIMTVPVQWNEPEQLHERSVQEERLGEKSGADG